MTIGNIDLGERPVLLAPMEDVTDASFRGICREQGADMVYTEFIPSEGLIRDAKKAYAKLKTSDSEAPVGIQIYGSDPDAMVEAARMADHAPEIVGGHGCDVIDINFGCPVSKIAGRGAGSGMMKDPDKMVMITRRIVEAVRKPVTVKAAPGLGRERQDHRGAGRKASGHGHQGPHHPRADPLPDVQGRGRLDPDRRGQTESEDAYSYNRKR